MRKTHKKIDNQLIESLTEVCETALEELTGFQWLTHLVNYANFPASLKIICVFDTADNLNKFLASSAQQELNKLIHKKLFAMNINIKLITRHISYDTQENCDKSNNGNWADRFST
jgi:hypothetical protein